VHGTKGGTAMIVALALSVAGLVVIGLSATARRAAAR
jgi:hypothetical protein